MKRSGQTFEFRSLNVFWERLGVPRESLETLVPNEADAEKEEKVRVHYRGKIILFTCLFKSDHLGLYGKVYVVTGPGLTIHEVAKVALVQPHVLRFLMAKVEEVSMNQNGESLLKVAIGSEWSPVISDWAPPVYFKIKDE